MENNYAVILQSEVETLTQELGRKNNHIEELQNQISIYEISLKNLKKLNTKLKERLFNKEEYYNKRLATFKNETNKVFKRQEKQIEGLQSTIYKYQTNKLIKLLTKIGIINV